MGTPFLLGVLSILQGDGVAPPQDPRIRAQAVLGRASKESDIDGAALVLSSLLSDGAALQVALSAPAALDERSVYVLFGGCWGPRAKVAWKDRRAWQRVLVASVSANPELIRAVLRADRYKSYIEKRNPRGAATINSFPFFAGSAYADDLVERFTESMRRETTHRAEPMRSPYSNAVIITSEEVEEDLLETWQMLCGVCGRLDLIRGATVENWRGRFAELDRWFRQDRPYIAWDDVRACIQVDGDAKEVAHPTPRPSRSIPELKPPWLSKAH